MKGPEAPRFIVIEGPLRVGKTTLARILAERLHARRIYDCEDNPFLGEFYAEKPGAALRAQMYFISAAIVSPRKFFATLSWRAGYDSLAWKLTPRRRGGAITRGGGKSV